MKTKSIVNNNAEVSRMNPGKTKESKNPITTEAIIR